MFVQGVGPVQIWQQGYQNKICDIVLKFWLTLGRSLHYFLVLLSLTLNILCFLWMSLNATLWHNFGEHQIGVIFMRVVAKHYFATLPVTRPLGCSSHIIIYKLLWRRRHFKFLLCIAHWQHLLNCSWDLTTLYR